MNKQFTVRYLIVLALAFCACRQKKSPPNVIFILVDDLGWADLSCYGSDFYETPNIDALAIQGMRFTDAYAASPVCSPTRAAILTGKYPSRLNITDWIPGRDPQDRALLGPEDLNQLPLEELTIAELLKTKGYQTFYAGKWHLGGEGFLPDNQGFDINKGGYHRGSPVSYYSPYHNPKLKDGPEDEYLSDRLVNESIKFLETAKDRPFLLYLSFYNVHTPIQANKQHVRYFKEKAAALSGIGDAGFRKEHEGLTKLRQDNADYASMVAAMDENVGRLMDKLDELGLSENSVVIFTSDNGGLSTLAHNRKAPTSNEPLRAGKGWCYQGGIRVPLIIKAPRVKANTVNHTPVISTDFFNTIAELTRVDKTAIPANDGKSLVPLLHQKGNWERKAIYWHFPHYHGSAWEPGAAIREDGWVYIEFYQDEKAELYDLENDPKETQNLVDAEPGKSKYLRERLHKMQLSSKARFPTVNPEFKK